MAMMASENEWKKSLRGGGATAETTTGTGSNSATNASRGSMNNYNKFKNSVNSPLQTSKTAKSKSPNKSTKAPVVRQSSSYYNSKKMCLNSKTSKTTVFMEGKHEVIEVHLPLKPPKFDWRVNDEGAYFELGTSSDNDDQYTINITIISASYLHLLENDQSNNRENFNWSIQYKAFDCEISSDQFQLSNDDVSRRTYIGDKATARIRASGGIFCEYLTHSTIEFHAVQQPLIDGKERVAGITCLDLKDLVKPNVNELKYILEMISPDADLNDTSTTKPEIRVLVELEAQPNFFKVIEKPAEELEGEIEVVQEKLRDVEISDSSVGGSKDQRTSKSKSTVTFQEDMPDSAVVPKIKGAPTESEEDNEGYLKEVLTEFQSHKENEASDDKLTSDLGITPSKGGGDELRPVVSSEYEVGGSLSKKSNVNQATAVAVQTERPKTRTPENVKTRTVVKTTPSPSTSYRDVDVSPASSYSSPQKNKIATFSFNSSESLTQSIEEAQLQPKPSQKGDLVDIVKAGTYRVTIQLNQFWVQSRSPHPLQDTFTLSYVYPPLGIVDKPIVCTAQPDSSVVSHNERNKCATILDGTWGIVVALSHLSDELLHQPLIVEVKNKKHDNNRPNYLYAELPFGSIFFQKLRHRKRVLTGSAEVLKTKDNRKVGVITYVIQLESLDDRKALHQDPARIPNKSKRGLKVATDDSVIRKTKFNLENWKIAEEQEFRKHLYEKEKAYLRILSQEWTKRDQEREGIVAEKTQSLREREKEVTKQMKIIYDREGSLKTLESEVKATAKKNISEQTQILETTRFRIRQIEAEHKHEVQTLQKRIGESIADFEKVKGKVLILESKLKDKEDELGENLRTRNKWPDVELSMKFDALEKQNEALCEQLAATQKDRDKYKREAGTLCQQLKSKQREQDARLHKENESLKVQLFASEQRKELTYERESVKELSEKIKKLLEQKVDSACFTLSGTRNELKISPHIRQRREMLQHLKEEDKSLLKEQKGKKDSREFLEKEIGRLVYERGGLLDSGSYSQYDAVVRNIENQITKLASRLNYITGC